MIIELNIAYRIVFVFCYVHHMYGHTIMLPTALCVYWLVYSNQTYHVIYYYQTTNINTHTDNTLLGLLHIQIKIY